MDTSFALSIIHFLEHNVDHVGEYYLIELYKETLHSKISKTIRVPKEAINPTTSYENNLNNIYLKINERCTVEEYKIFSNFRILLRSISDLQINIPNGTFKFYFNNSKAFLIDFILFITDGKCRDNFKDSYDMIESFKNMEEERVSNISIKSFKNGYVLLKNLTEPQLNNIALITNIQSKQLYNIKWW